MGNWFYVFMLAGFFIPLWISVNIGTAVIAMDLLALSYYFRLPAEAWPLIAIINVFAIAEHYFYKPLAPQYNH